MGLWEQEGIRRPDSQVEGGLSWGCERIFNGLLAVPQPDTFDFNLLGDRVKLALLMVDAGDAREVLVLAAQLSC